MVIPGMQTGDITGLINKAKDACNTDYLLFTGLPYIFFKQA